MGTQTRINVIDFFKILGNHLGNAIKAISENDIDIDNNLEEIKELMDKDLEQQAEARFGNNHNKLNDEIGEDGRVSVDFASAKELNEKDQKEEREKE